MNYGIPYQGSKNRIAKDIVEILPKGKRFVDLFAGGCAMTHAAMLSGKYEHFLVNDLYPFASQLFKDAMNGEFSKPEYFRWVSRDEFFEKKDSDPFVKVCYSFGNNGKDYMYSKKLEPLKKAFHYAVVFDEWTYLEEYAKEHNWKDGLIDEMKKSVEGIESIDQRRLKLTKPAYDNRVIGFPSNMLQNLERLNRLNITTLNSNIDFTSFDYREYEHQDGDVVYCDPPYSNTGKYDGREFDNEAFYDWVRQQPYSIYFSEYSAPDDFVPIWQKQKARLGGGGNSSKYGKALEQVYIHKKFV